MTINGKRLFNKDALCKKRAENEWFGNKNEGTHEGQIEDKIMTIYEEFFIKVIAP